MIKYLKPFGTPCTVFIPPSKRGTKSHCERGQIGHFVGIEEDGIILYRVYIPKTTAIVTTSDVRFHGVVSVPPEIGQPCCIGRTDNPSAPRIDTRGVRDGIRKDGVRDGNDDMPVMDVRDFQYLVGTRHVDDEDGSTYQTIRGLIEGDWLVAYRRLKEHILSLD